MIHTSISRRPRGVVLPNSSDLGLGHRPNRLPTVSAKQPLSFVSLPRVWFHRFQAMAPKRKLTPTEWVTMDVNGLAVEWKLTATGMVHFRWEGSAKQTLTLTKDEEAQDAPRRVRARVTPAAVVAANASQAAREPAVGEPAAQFSSDAQRPAAQVSSDAQHPAARASWDVPTQDVGVSIAAAAVAMVTASESRFVDCSGDEDGSGDELPWLHLSGRGQGGIVKTPNHCGPAAKSVSVSSFAEASVVHRLHTGGCGVGMACNAMSCLWSCHAVSFGIPLLIPCQPLNSRLGGNMRSLFHILFVTTPFTSIGRPLLICMRLQSMTHRWPFIGSAVAQPYKATWSTLALQSIQSQFDDSSCVCRLPEHRVACSLS